MSWMEDLNNTQSASARQWPLYNACGPRMQIRIINAYIIPSRWVHLQHRLGNVAAGTKVRQFVTDTIGVRGERGAKEGEGEPHNAPMRAYVETA